MECIMFSKQSKSPVRRLLRLEFGNNFSISNAIGISCAAIAHHFSQSINSYS